MIWKSKIQITAPQAEGANETFTLLRGALLCAGKTCRDIGIKSLLTRLIEFVHGARLDQALRKLSCRCRCGICLRK